MRARLHEITDTLRPKKYEQIGQEAHLSQEGWGSGAAGVLDGSVDWGQGAVLNQILNTRLWEVELERRLKETDELEAKLEEMAEAFERQKGGSGYGSVG